MTGFSDYTAQNLLAYVTGKTAMPALPTSYLALFTTAPTADAGTGGTEVSGGSYTRVTTSGANWNTPTASSGTAPGIVSAFTSNSATLTFPTASANWGTVLAFGLYDAATVGNLLVWDYLGNFAWRPVSVSAVGSGAGAVFTSPAHGLSNGDPVVVTTKYGGALPTFTQSNFTGVLVVANATVDTFTVTNGGTAVWTSTTSDFAVRKILQQSIPSGVTASFTGGTPGALLITSA